MIWNVIPFHQYVYFVGMVFILQGVMNRRNNTLTLFYDVLLLFKFNNITMVNNLSGYSCTCRLNKILNTYSTSHHMKRRTSWFHTTCLDPDRKKGSVWVVYNFRTFYAIVPVSFAYLLLPFNKCVYISLLKYIFCISQDTVI